MNESIVAILGLGVLAGGSIIVIDALVVRKIRHLAATSEPSEDPGVDGKDRT